MSADDAPPRRGSGGAASAAAVASPCNRVCRIDAATGWCLGCGRTLDEIAAWASMGDDSRRRVLESLPARRAPGRPGPGAG